MSGQEVLIQGCDTLPKLFLKVSAERGERIAMREKDFGIWQSYTWGDYRERACEIAWGLLSLGLERGDVVSIQSEDCREWLWADIGAMLAGGVVNGIYPTYQWRQVEHTLTDSNCRFLFAEDEEQLDKYLEIEDKLPNIERVFVFDWTGLRDFEHDKVAPLDALLAMGRKFGADNEGLIERIAELVREKKLEGVSDLRDESDRDGMRIVIELKKDEPSQVVLNNLYKMTPMQTSFGIILLAIVKNQPKVLNLREALVHFIEHRRNVVRRRTVFDLGKAEARAHILEGLKRALDMLDDAHVLGLIMNSIEMHKISSLYYSYQYPNYAYYSNAYAYGYDYYYDDERGRRNRRRRRRGLGDRWDSVAQWARRTFLPMG